MRPYGRTAPDSDCVASDCMTAYVCLECNKHDQAISISPSGCLRYWSDFRHSDEGCYGSAKTASSQLVEHSFVNLALRQGLWKFTPRPKAKSQLFDLGNDLGETRNVVVENPKIAKAAAESLEAVRREAR